LGVINYPISQAVLDQVFNRLSSGLDGFNYVYNQLAPNYGLAADMDIVFVPTEDFSMNFSKSNVNPQDWLDTSGFKYPFVTLFSERSQNQNLEKFHQFSGEVVIGFNVFLSWKQSRVLVDFESYTHCVEETVYTILNRCRGNFFPGDQDWSKYVVYNGDIEMQKSGLQRGGYFWVQLCAFKATFEVNQFGQTS
jgi:hypothetical protein